MKKFLLSVVFVAIFSLLNLSSAIAETVIYNTQSGIYHNTSCYSASKCTKNCVKMDKKEAVKKGRPCKKCGG
jgi:methylphosphotriester-DNA--protein-cysteine methyltransferase